MRHTQPAPPHREGESARARERTAAGRPSGLLSKPTGTGHGRARDGLGRATLAATDTSCTQWSREDRGCWLRAVRVNSCRWPGNYREMPIPRSVNGLWEKRYVSLCRYPNAKKVLHFPVNQQLRNKQNDFWSPPKLRKKLETVF